MDFKKFSSLFQALSRKSAISSSRECFLKPSSAIFNYKIIYQTDRVVSTVCGTNWKDEKQICQNSYQDPDSEQHTNMISYIHAEAIYFIQPHDLNGSINALSYTQISALYPH